jgi:cyclic-di-GMP-binding protein
VKNSFFLVIPTKQKKPEYKKSFEDRSVQQWIQELPTANPGLTTRLFHDYIKEFNETTLDSQVRLDALELLRPSFQVIEDYLRSRLIKFGFPKEESEQKIFEVFSTIERDFAMGYWIVVRDLTRRNISWFKSKNAALAIQRVVKYLSSTVLTHYIMCVDVPDWVWMDLHSLYKLSVKIKKETQKVQDDTRAFHKSTSVLDCYKQILLLSLVEPTGLMQKEIQQVYSFIENITDLVELKSSAVPGVESQCMVLVDEDKMPFWSSGNTDGSLDSAVLYLDFTLLLNEFKKPNRFVSNSKARFSSMHAVNNNLSKLPPELIEYLYARWSGISIQGTPFFMDRLDRYFSIGLNSAYDFQSPLTPIADSSIEYLAESSSDRTLACKFQQHGVLSIGSLVSYRKSETPKHLRSLAVVKKISIAKSDAKLNFELQPICPHSHPVTFLNMEAGENEEPQKALLYAVKEKDGEKSYIIMESFQLKENDIIRVTMNKQEITIILRDRKNIGLGCWQFECRQVTLREKQVQLKKGYDFI